MSNVLLPMNCIYLLILLLRSSIAALANKMSVSANELSKRKNAPSFVPDVSIKIDDENNITLQNTVDDNSKKIDQYMLL